MYDFWLIPVAVKSKAWVCGHSFGEIAGSIPTRAMEYGVIEDSHSGGLGPLCLSSHDKKI